MKIKEAPLLLAGIGKITAEIYMSNCNPIVKKREKSAISVNNDKNINPIEKPNSNRSAITKGKYNKEKPGRQPMKSNITTVTRNKIAMLYNRV